MANLTHFIRTSKAWYADRKIRERLFILALSFSLIYSLFHFAIFRPISHSKALKQQKIVSTNSEIENLKIKINALNKLKKTPLYKEWILQRQTLIGMRYHYQTLLQSFDKSSWTQVIHTTLKDFSNIKLVKINILPEKQYKPDNKTIFKTPIFEQSMRVSIISDYFSTISYINKLKKILPNIYWNQFEYKVIQYPYAKVDMEFSVFYEKQKSSLTIG